MNNKRTYTVYFRTGGTANFKWHRIAERYTTDEAAIAKKQELHAMGFPACYEYTDVLDRIGLPETFSADQPTAS